MFYETDHSLYGDMLKIQSGADFNFPAHLHNSFELITVTDGEMMVTIDKKQYTVTPDTAVLVFPNQIHELCTPRYSRHSLCIFSSQLVQGYSKVFLNFLPESNLFTPQRFYLRELLDMNNGENILRTKGLLYCLCAEFDEAAVYRERNIESADLLQRIFDFVESNYNKNCSLDALAAFTSYHSVYLSRYFKQSTGLTFTDYVNRHRINMASYILKNTQKKILAVAYDCGFDSLRSFNRNFKAIMGTTPKEYRSEISDSPI